MAGNDEDRGWSRRLDVEGRGSLVTSRVHGHRTIGRSDEAVCDLHCTHGGDEERGFSGLASKPLVTVCQWFGINHCDSFLVWTSTPRSMVF
jgi:hypothetical protein